jgi:hypothetical protein
VIQGVALLTVQQVGSERTTSAGRSGAWEVMILLIGLAFVGYGTVAMLRLHRWRAQALPAKGRVVDNVPQPSRSGGTVWLSLIEFEADGSHVRFPILAAAPRRRWPLGHTIDVLYDPADPNRAGLADGALTVPWALILGVAVVGLFLAIVV